MTRRLPSAALIGIALERSGLEPLHIQLYRQVRDAVLAGRLAPGARLPSSRDLAQGLQCSRNTVMNALDQLHSEGYLEGQRGSGTYVSAELPDRLLKAARGPAPRRPENRPAGHDLSARGRVLTGLIEPRAGGSRAGGSRAFVSGVPALDHFPFDVWGRLLGRTWRRPPGDLIRHGEPAGYLPLRAAIADYLTDVRALVCRPEQVMITSGVQQAVALVAGLLLDPGDEVWIEEPGYPGLRGPLLGAGLELVPVTLDGEGLSVEAGRRRAPDARLAVVTPSHQYPLGRTMSLARRLALLDWAHDEGAWILEDDYDSEYRYAGRPLAALQGLDAGRPDGGGRVIYLGSFSKVLFPALRLGYLVVPEALVEAFARGRAALDDHPSAIAQPVLASFIQEGHFAAHVRRMRRLYAARQEALLEAAGASLGGLLDLAPDEAGLHLVARLAPDLAARMTDRQAARRADAAGITAAPLSPYFLEQPTIQGLMLGYAAVSEEEIAPAARRLAVALAP